jgi:regulator of sirC expression with transglutaminase-like and TPR domain
VDADLWLAEIDRLAAGVTHFEALRQRLFVEEGFAGATDDYYDPDNSLLHRVLERRRGIPISLSVVAIEVGRRAGVVVEGIGMPGHFLIRSAGSDQFCDPFHGGALLDERDCETRFRHVTGADATVPFGAESLPVVDDHQILARMLANLAHIYRAQGKPSDLEWVLRCQRALPGMATGATLHLAETLTTRGRFRDAARELEATATQANAADRQRLLQVARAVRARLN